MKGLSVFVLCVILAGAVGYAGHTAMTTMSERVTAAFDVEK